jgi:GntR family transcriptional regulator
MTTAPLRLDHHSRIPLHVQAERLLRVLILQPQYQNGDFLPDEVTLARQLGVSRNTLRAAITRLTYEGLLERKAGVGTSVASGSQESRIAEWHSFTQEMERKGIEVQTFQLDVRTIGAAADVAAALKIAPGREVLRIDRLRGWDDAPIVHFRSFLHPRLGLKNEEDFTKPLYRIIESRSGVTVDGAHEEMRAVAADAMMAKLLRVRRGTPLLRRNRAVYDHSGRPIEFAIVHYLSSHFALVLDIRRGRA